MAALVLLFLCTVLGVNNLIGQEAPTWSSRIASIVYAKCTPCHRPGEIAPFGLTSYDEVASSALQIKAVTQSRYMPPWKPAHEWGEFMGDRSLSDDEVSAIARWVDAGAPPGNLAEAPSLPEFPKGSQLGTPDMVLEMSEEWHVEGNNRDVYRYFVLPTNLLENKAVKALEFRPGNPKVVHHVLYFLDTTGTARAKDAADPAPGYAGFGDPGFESAASYLGWVPGSQMRFYPESIGAQMFKGSDLVIQVHYAPSPVAQTDRSHVNVFFQNNPNPRVVQEFSLNPLYLREGLFLIPANQVRSYSSAITIPFNVSIIAVAPHMHLLGINARAFAVTPQGDTIGLIRINDWDFNWQGSYAFKKPIVVPGGSQLVYEASYDNTANNPLNPNSPPKLVGWGESTSDEMLLCYFHWLPYQPGDENLSMETIPTSVQEMEPKPVFDVTLWPNPATSHATLAFTLNGVEDLDVTITDAMGSTILQPHAQAPFQNGRHVLDINVNALSSGAYFLLVNGKGAAVSLPLYVAR